MRQIIAMGGGGFTMEPDNPLLDEYVVQAIPAESPKVLFIPTASGDNQGYVESFHQAFGALGCRCAHLCLFQVPTRDLESYVLEYDAVYVGGGNTFNMLTLWRAWGLDRIFRSAYDAGVVLAGLSAGSVCWFEQFVSDSFTPPDSTELAPLDGLGFLPGSHCPHYHGTPSRRPEYHRLVADGTLADGWAADDGAALHFIDDELHAVVSSRPEALAYRIERRVDGVAETPEETRYLGD